MHITLLCQVLRDTGMRTENYLRIHEHMQSFCIRTQFPVLRHLPDSMTAWIEVHYNYPGVLRDPGFSVYVLLANFSSAALCIVSLAGSDGPPYDIDHVKPTP